MLRYEYELYDANIGGMYYLTTPPFWYILLPGNNGVEPKPQGGMDSSCGLPHACLSLSLYIYLGKYHKIHKIQSLVQKTTASNTFKCCLDLNS